MNNRANLAELSFDSVNLCELLDTISEQIMTMQEADADGKMEALTHRLAALNWIAAETARGLSLGLNALADAEDAARAAVKGKKAH